MASKLDSIIQVNITRETKPISQVGFGIPLIIGESTKLDSRISKYSNISEVANDFAETDIEYLMAQTGFSQEITPEEIWIGKKVETASGSSVVSATQISGTLVNFEIIDHKVEVGVSASMVGFTPAAYDGTFIVVSIIDEDNFTVNLASDPGGDATVVGTYGATETWSSAIQGCYDYNSNWYGLVISSVVDADIIAAATKIESLERLYIARSDDNDIYDDSVSDDIASDLKALGYNRTLLMYSGTATSKYNDIAWLSRTLPKTPGSINWAYKTLVGVVADELTSTQMDTVAGEDGKNANVYVEISGISVPLYGRVSSGLFVDSIRGSDWLKARIQEAIFSELVNSDKIPYTNQGIAIIVNLIRGVIDAATANGYIRQKANGLGDYTVTAPLLENTSVIDRTNRILRDVKFVAYEANAINNVKIEGTVTV